MIEINNFDFLVGKWSVLNRRLKERLVGCEDWEEFTGEMETREILNGNGTMDEMRSPHFGDGFVGFSVRICDPKSSEWTIYWADTETLGRGMTEQVVGKFANGTGEFHGTESFNGKYMKLRFRWNKEATDTAHWEQAYFDNSNGKWETNWTMLFTRLD